ncbi:hypothetical protein [Streptomyces sp. NPDC090021]|uniref:hypothetical protein n=1 Tax=Streptomyces sp. NPDC090021 TaxID=3365919 RepID=UPI00380F7040
MTVGLLAADSNTSQLGDIYTLERITADSPGNTLTVVQSPTGQGEQQGSAGETMAADPRFGPGTRPGGTLNAPPGCGVDAWSSARDEDRIRARGAYLASVVLDIWLSADGLRAVDTVPAIPASRTAGH